MCQATMAVSTQKQEVAANKKRTPATTFWVGDKVWLDTRNYKTDRPKRSLDFKHAKYWVAEVISPTSVRLGGITGDIEKTFHTDLLRRAPEDPLVGQVNDDDQPEPVLIEGHQEWHVEKILGWKKARKRGEFKVCVKWTSYHKPTWPDYREVEDTQAIADFERIYGKVGESDGKETVSAKPRRTPCTRMAKRISSIGGSQALSI